jgi:trans-aconitate 2-methyltransferase
MSWDPVQYLRFEGERLRPAQDLLARVPVAAATAVADLGCGAGNVARVLADRWPSARIVGVDSSREMLAAARAATAGSARFEFREADLAAWSAAGDERYDVVFSNALLHWLDDHGTVLARWCAALAPGGALAVQAPDNFAAPSHTELFALARSPHWRERLEVRVRAAPMAALDAYQEWLAPHAARVDVWSTIYLHVLAPAAGGEHPVVAWTKGTTLTPFLAALDTSARAEFLADYGAAMRRAYPPRGDGSVCFPFKRVFMVAVRGG